MWIVMKMMMPCGIIFEVDKHGEIVRALMDPKGEKLSFISEVEDDAGILYIGSFREPYIGKLDTFKLKTQQN